ncbi:uncharacterized protein LOC120206891 [Hibiscus syriacus]|uniref:uncharacterized protein LOC120206891 n=1 Tax=Hibiscus syriacus TaxID=106335 RepID=UPI0019232F8F|nr:uncharacterized protein LOC120206891 [Hibiscus syriacus]
MASAPEQPEISLREWSLKARIRHENTVSRRYSGSYIRNTSSHPSNFTISSTTSSPACSFKVGIDPSTYSFTAALKALQARSLYNSLECSPEVFALNSKWNEAEKYICNPLSGEFPMECLSAKTLSGRSFRKLANKITVSGPLVYPSTIVEEDIAGSPIPAESLNRDEGTPPPHPTSPSSVSTPSILETALNPSGTETGDSPFSNTKSKSDEQSITASLQAGCFVAEIIEACPSKDEVKETKEKKEEAIIDKEDDKIRTREKDEERKWNCLSWD